MVLDTNAVLDATVFADAGMRRLAEAITAGHLRWLACSPMRLELVQVLQGRLLGARLADAFGLREETLAWFDRWACLQEPPPHTLLPRLRCSDADDQPFIDLALQAGATYLISQDRAVLKLARKARALGLLVLRPRDWPPA